MAKLERYVGQLVEDRGGVDDSVMETIVRDIERSSRVKNAQKKVRGRSYVALQPSSLQCLFCFRRQISFVRWKENVCTSIASPASHVPGRCCS